MLLCSPDWSFTSPEQARQADFGGEWRGMAGEQTSELVSAAEEAGPQVARRHAWVGALALVRCQRWHFLTMAIHKQESQQRASVPREWRTGPGWVLQHTQAKEEDMYGSVCIKHDTLAHKHTNKDLFLLTHTHTSTEAHLLLRAGSTEASEACGVLTEHLCQEFCRVVPGWVIITRRVSVVCSPAPASGAQLQEV